MKLKKIIISAFLIMTLAVLVATPILARSNIILIEDRYYYSEDGTYITSVCATSAGEPQLHRAVAEAISFSYGVTKSYGNWHLYHSSAAATQYIGSHSDSFHNYYELGEINK